MKKAMITEKIHQASRVIGKTWPLYSFVTSNPLSGYEDLPFHKALDQAEKMLEAQVYPSGTVLKYAWQNGKIASAILEEELGKNKISKSIDQCLELLEGKRPIPKLNENNELDREMSKWLSSFLDEGLAEWPMPFKEEGFFKAWRKLVKYDSKLKDKLDDIPGTSLEAIATILKIENEEDYLKIFIHHLAALPGWTGYINYRTQNGSEWNSMFPLELEDYLAVRLSLARALNLPISPSNREKRGTDEWQRINLAFLRAWEYSFQSELINELAKDDGMVEKNTKKSDAQFVFCIDTRSEQIRRHVESTGNYETFGYAGFFGIAMDYFDEETGVIKKSCPPILNSTYKVGEIAQPNKDGEFEKRKKSILSGKFQEYFLTRMKNMLPSAFGFVEGSGLAYGGALLSRTIFPGLLYKKNKNRDFQHTSFCDTELYHRNSEHLDHIPNLDKAKILKTAFDLLGWKDYAPLVVFAGHGSHTANNAFGSSLDCGACAASPGRHNARMLARIANSAEVRNILSIEYGIKIPDDSFFIAAEHNTTTDEILLFDSLVPESHMDRLNNLKRDLKIVQENATASRLEDEIDGVSIAETKANDWSETRPEWGLAKNAGFIIGHRKLTRNKDLHARCFLHSYDWKEDKKGLALEAIMQGPMTVTQWINNHYYFSTVDNDKFGGSTKITHNITGRFGVVEGNGGDLKMGLPLQSVKQTDTEMYHEPLRLSVVINAPTTRVEEILERNGNLEQLIKNEWIHLLVIDPLQDNRVVRFTENGWIEIDTASNQKSDPVMQDLELAR